MVTTPNFDLDTDTTLGGSNASDYTIASQKAIKSYVDNSTGATVDQTFDSTSVNAQSGVAIEGELSTKYVKASVQDEDTGSQSFIENQGTGINCLLYDNQGNTNRGLYIDSSRAEIYYEDFTGNGYNSVSASDSGVLIYCEGSFEFGDSNGSVTLSTSNNNLAVNGSEVALKSDIPDISTKQDTLVSGTNIKTVNNTSLLGSGNIAVQPILVSGTNIKTINNTSLLGSGNIDTSEIFIAQYDSTTYNEILTAYNAGKEIICRDSGVFFILSGINLNNNVFAFSNNTSTQHILKTISNGIWTTSVTNIAKSDLSNVSSISSSSAVYTALGNKQDTLVSGTNIKTINNTSLLGSGNLSLANTTLSNVLSIDNSSAVATALNGKADTDLSNLSSTGKELIDGQWVLGLNYTLSSATAIGTYTCDLTSYLPSGNDKYEVLIDCQIVATNSTYVGIKDGTYDNYAFCATGGGRPARNIIAIALTGKTFKYDIAGAALSSGYLRLRGYRRIGTNT